MHNYKYPTNNENYFLSTNNELLNVEKIWFWLKDCMWSSNIPIEYVRRFIEFSLCFGVYEKLTNEQVGFGRAITDHTTYAYICDIVIAPSHRKKGLATDLLKFMLAHPHLEGLKTISLRTTESARNIYLKSGFLPAQASETILEQEDLNIYNNINFINLYSEVEVD